MSEELSPQEMRHWLAAVADTDERDGVRELASAVLGEFDHLRHVEALAMALVHEMTQSPPCQSPRFRALRDALCRLPADES